jgi:hypothetical protein
MLPYQGTAAWSSSATKTRLAPTHCTAAVPITSPLQAPPQLWRMDLIKDGEGSKDARLAYVRTYRPNGKVDFAGPSYFCGTTKDDLVVVPTKSVLPVSNIESSWAHNYIQECRDSYMGQGIWCTSLLHFGSNHSLVSQRPFSTFCRPKTAGILQG